MEKVFGYVNVQLAEQSELVGLKRAKRYSRALMELCMANLAGCTEVELNLSREPPS